MWRCSVPESYPAECQVAVGLRQRQTADVQRSLAWGGAHSAAFSEQRCAPPQHRTVGMGAGPSAKTSGPASRRNGTWAAAACQCQTFPSWLLLRHVLFWTDRLPQVRLQVQIHKALLTVEERAALQREGNGIVCLIGGPTTMLCVWQLDCFRFGNKCHRRQPRN